MQGAAAAACCRMSPVPSEEPSSTRINSKEYDLALKYSRLARISASIFRASLKHGITAERYGFNGAAPRFWTDRKRACPELRQYTACSRACPRRHRDRKRWRQAGLQEECGVFGTLFSEATESLR